MFILTLSRGKYQYIHRSDWSVRYLREVSYVINDQRQNLEFIGGSYITGDYVPIRF